MLDQFNAWLSDFRDWEGSEEEKHYREFFRKSKAKSAAHIACAFLKLWGRQHELKGMHKDEEDFLKRYLPHSLDEKRTFQNWIIEDWEKTYSTKRGQKSIIERCDSMIGFYGYKIPKDPSSVIHDLAVCFFFFSHPEYDSLCPAMKESITTHLVNLNGQFIAAVSRFTAWQEREHVRVLKASEALKRQLAVRKQIVLDAYHRADAIRSNTKPHTAARVIRETLRTKRQDPPSIKTILRYLREEKLVP